MDPMTAMLLFKGVEMVGNFIVGAKAARDANKINEETYQRFVDMANNYEAEMSGNLPPGTVDPIVFERFKEEVKQLVPEIAHHIPEAAPQQVLETGVAEERQAQKQALRQYGQLAQAGYDPIAAAQQEAALSASAAQASAARQAALREAGQRGLGGTGLDVLAGMGATEQAAVGGRQAALQAQAEAGQRRLQALGQYANLAGQMRQQGTQTEQTNVGIMNAFNERMARNLNQYNQYVAEMKNQANRFNLENQQRREEMNVQLANQQRLLNAQREAQASEARRAARERMTTTKYNIQSGLGKMQSEMAGQGLSREYLPWQQALSTIGKTGDAATGAYFKFKDDEEEK